MTKGDSCKEENEFKKSLDVVAQEEEPDEVSKEFANKLGVDEKNIVSTGNTIKSTYYSFTVLSWTKGKEYPGYALPEGKNLADYPGAVLDEQGNITSECMSEEHNGGRKRSANHISVVRDNRRWNSNFSGTFDGQFRTLQFYGRKIRTRRGKGSYVSVRNLFHMVS